jgi:hypothetical protein
MNEGCPKVLECIKETARLLSTLLNDMGGVGLRECWKGPNSIRGLYTGPLIPGSPGRNPPESTRILPGFLPGMLGTRTQPNQQFLANLRHPIPGRFLADSCLINQECQD